MFPPFAVGRVTRQLIQRIFCDQAFGIQSRVDAVLSPRPPREPLGLGDYLDALTTGNAPCHNILPRFPPCPTIACPLPACLTLYPRTTYINPCI